MIALVVAGKVWAGLVIAAIGALLAWAFVAGGNKRPPSEE